MTCDKNGSIKPRTKPRPVVVQLELVTMEPLSNLRSALWWTTLLGQRAGEVIEARANVIRGRNPTRNARR